MRKIGLYEGILLFGIAAVERSPPSEFQSFRFFGTVPVSLSEFRHDAITAMLTELGSTLLDFNLIRYSQS